MNTSIRLPVVFIFSSYYLSLAVLLYLLIAQLVHLFAPADAILDPKLQDNSYVRFLFTLAFSTAGVGSITAITQGYLKPISFLKQAMREKTSSLTIAFFLSNFYLADLSHPTSKLVAIVGITLFFAFILPTIIEFYATTNTKHLLTKMISYTMENRKPHSRTILLIHICSMIVILFSFFTVIHILRMYATGKIAIENQLRTTLYIHTIFPRKTTHAGMVRMKGYNFGWHSDNRSRIMSSDGEIPSHLWTDTSIDFEVPLHIKEGLRSVWLERPIDEGNSTSMVVTSNKVPLTVASRFIFYPEPYDSISTKIVKRFKLYINTYMQIIGQFLL